MNEMKKPTRIQKNCDDVKNDGDAGSLYNY